jgi:hypothetical protein
MAPTDTAVEVATPMPTLNLRKCSANKRVGFASRLNLKPAVSPRLSRETVGETRGRAVHLRLAAAPVK